MTAPPHASHMVEVSSAAAAASHHSGWSTSVRHDMEIPSAHFSRASEAVSPPEHRPHWRASLDMIERNVPVTKRLIRAQDTLYTCGSPFETLHLINSGIFKIVSLASDGRERSADFVFDGDWLGFDGIPSGHHTCTAVALDIGEVWAVRYDSLMQAAAKDPSLLHQVLAAISAQLARNRDIALAIGTLSAEARVADFLLMWARSLAERGRRTDEINVHMSRSEMGAFLGIRLESVSRALAKLARSGVISFNERGRRDISIPCLSALSRFVRNETEPGDRLLQ